MRAGRTPVPCSLCNQGVKFIDLVAFAKDLGADCLATGHYVRRVVNGDRPELHKGADPARDQSYFLYGTTREQLDFLRFPLGDLPKNDVRRIAEEEGLIVAAKPDSQDICFVPDGDYAGLVQRLRPETIAPGEIVDLDGNVLGAHRGVVHFTVGQRRGIESRRPERAALRRPDRARGAAAGRRSAPRARGRGDAGRAGQLDRRGSDGSRREGALACAAGAGEIDGDWVRFERPNLAWRPARLLSSTTAPASWVADGSPRPWQRTKRSRMSRPPSAGIPPLSAHFR